MWSITDEILKYKKLKCYTHRSELSYKSGETVCLDL